MRRGLATPDALGLGLETDRAGRLVGRGGEAAPDLYAIGPPRARALWASTAVPEIRVRARDVANRLLRARRRAAR